MFQSIRGLRLGLLRYRRDIGRGLVVWTVFSFLFALTPIVFIWGPAYFRGMPIEIFSLAERGDLSIISVGILASAIGKFVDSPKQRHRNRLGMALLGMIGILFHGATYLVIRLSEGQLNTEIVEQFSLNATLSTIVFSITVVLLSELKLYFPRG